MQLGTLSASPVACVAGLKTMEVLRREGAFETLEENGKRLMQIQSDALRAKGLSHHVVGEPPLFDILFIDRDVETYRDTKAANACQSATWNAALRAAGIFKATSKVYPSLALSEDDFTWMETACDAAATAVADMED